MILGVNHPMLDFENDREKRLDLVVARPSGKFTPGKESFKELVFRYGIVLSDQVNAHLADLPDIPVADVGAVLIALEAKAAMTAHVAALPRLYDELNSSHQAVHGASNQAIAIAYVQVNAAPAFISSVSNRYRWTEDTPATVTQHKQPYAVERVIDKINKLPRRSNPTGRGFDGIGVTVLNLENAGGSVDLMHAPPAPKAGDAFHYESMIVRMANEYDSRFSGI